MPSSAATITNPSPFKLERYFGVHEFTAKVLLSSSDVESLSVKELLKIATHAGDDASLAAWDGLSLGYTESQGHPDLLAEIASTYTGVTPQHVLEVAPEEGILIAMSCLVHPGDTVITCWPAYQSLYEVAKARGANLIKWGYAGGGEQPVRFDVSTLEALITGVEASGSSVKLITINFPHNPTGAWLSAEELRAVCALAERCGAHLFSDEMYRGLEHGDDGAPLPSACEVYPRAVVLSGLSKTYAMPGLRMGWLVSRDAAFFQAAVTFKDYTTICGSAPSEILALMALRHRKTIVARSKRILAEGAAALQAFCAAHADKFYYHPPKAGPVAYLQVKGSGLTSDDGQKYSEALVEKTGVMVVSSAMFEDEGGGCFFRLGFAKEGFAQKLAAWGSTFDEVKLPGF